MAHFAQLDDNNVVQRVIVVNNSVLTNNGTQQEDESVGIAFCKELYGENTKWIQTSYNNNFRKRYASIGYTYNIEYDSFIPPKPYASWSLNTETYDWQAPVPMPEDGKPYVWNEETGSWVEANFGIS